LGKKKPKNRGWPNHHRIQEKQKEHPGRKGIPWVVPSKKGSTGTGAPGGKRKKPKGEGRGGSRVGLVWKENPPDCLRKEKQTKDQTSLILWRATPPELCRGLSQRSRKLTFFPKSNQGSKLYKCSPWEPCVIRGGRFAKKKRNKNQGDQHLHREKRNQRTKPMKCKKKKKRTPGRHQGETGGFSKKETCCAPQNKKQEHLSEKPKI